MRWALSVIWGIFTILFFTLGYAHWIDSESEIPPFTLSQRPLAGHGAVGILGADVDQLIKDFAGGCPILSRNPLFLSCLAMIPQLFDFTEFFTYKALLYFGTPLASIGR